jgi:hypothetical protein
MTHHVRLTCHHCRQQGLGVVRDHDRCQIEEVMLDRHPTQASPGRMWRGYNRRSGLSAVIRLIFVVPCQTSVCMNARVPGSSVNSALHLSYTSHPGSALCGRVSAIQRLVTAVSLGSLHLCRTSMTTMSRYCPTGTQLEQSCEARAVLSPISHVFGSHCHHRSGVLNPDVGLGLRDQQHH